MAAPLSHIINIPFLRRAQVEMGSFLIQGGFAPSLCGQTLLFNLLQPKSEALTVIQTTDIYTCSWDLNFKSDA